MMKVSFTTVKTIADFGFSWRMMRFARREFGLQKVDCLQNEPGTLRQSKIQNRRATKSHLTP